MTKLIPLLVVALAGTGIRAAPFFRAPQEPLSREPAATGCQSHYEWATPQQVAIATKSRFSLDCYGRLWCLLLCRPSDWDSSTLSAARYDGSQWLEPEVVYTGGEASGLGGFDATRAQDGKLWVAFSPEDITAAALYYDGTSWSDIYRVGVGVGMSTGYSLESDSSGKVWAVFVMDEDCRILVDVCEDTFWSGAHAIMEFPDHRQVMRSRLTVAPNGDKWAGATATADGDTYRVFLCRSDSAGNWADSLIFGPGPTQGYLEGLAADGQGNIWVAWPGNSYGPDSGIYAARLDTDLHWSSVYRISCSGFFCRMEIDGDNKVWVVWDAGSNFYYRVWDGAEWSPPDSIVPPSASCYMDDIFYDPVRGRIWLSYRIDGGQQTFVTWTDASVGVAEEEPAIIWRPGQTLIVRGVLFLPPATGSSPSARLLLDVSGRKVMSLWPGANDVRALAPGVYFVRPASSVRHQASGVTKVVLTE